MARHTLPRVPDMWNRHECMYIEVFSIALEKLAASTCDTSSEPALSEALCLILKEVSYEEGQRKNQDIPTPFLETPLQPMTKADLSGGKASKRPDFTCRLTDHTATFDCFEISLHIECKRLGKPTSKSWCLNKNYVTEGIMRFDSSEYGYGEYAFSGLMIGYIVSMTPEQILSEVNEHQKTHCSHNPDIEHRSSKSRLHCYYQRLIRTSLMPKDFGLTHLWAEMINQ